MRLSFYTASLIALLMAVPTARAACSQEVSTPLQFVSLWDHEKAKVEGLNRINELCKDENYSRACLEKYLTPTVSILPLYTEPNGSKPFAVYSVKFAPGEGGKISYLNLTDGSTARFDPDMFDPDWGYGPPYFHQTLLNKKGDWYEVSLPLFVDGRTSGWVQLANEPDVLSLAKGNVVIFNSRAYTIVEVKADEVLLRDEQPADMWCEPGDAPALEAFETISVPLKQLYTNNCQLRLHIAYTRGC